MIAQVKCSHFMLNEHRYIGYNVHMSEVKKNVSLFHGELLEGTTAFIAG